MPSSRPTPPGFASPDAPNMESNCARNGPPVPVPDGKVILRPGLAWDSTGSSAAWVHSTNGGARKPASGGSFGGRSLGFATAAGCESHPSGDDENVRGTNSKKRSPGRASARASPVCSPAFRLSYPAAPRRVEKQQAKACTTNETSKVVLLFKRSSGTSGTAVVPGFKRS